MASCEDEYEPECEGSWCPEWGQCKASKQMMKEDSSLREEWREERRERVKKEILDVQKECGMPDWDGYGASPVLKDSVDFALLYAKLLPTSLPIPCPTCDNQGRIYLQWGDIKEKAVILRFDNMATRKITLMTIDHDDIKISHPDYNVRSINKKIREHLKEGAK